MDDKIEQRILRGKVLRPWHLYDPAGFLLLPEVLAELLQISLAELTDKELEFIYERRT